MDQIVAENRIKKKAPLKVADDDGPARRPRG